MAPFTKSDSLSKGSDSRRVYLGFRHATFGAFLLCTCAFILFELFRYAHLISIVEVEQFADPSFLDAEVPAVLLQPEHQNATDQVLLQELSSIDQVLNIEVHDPSSEPDDHVLTDIDNMEENDKDVVGDDAAGEQGPDNKFGNQALDTDDGTPPAHDDASVFSENTTTKIMGSNAEDGRSFTGVPESGITGANASMLETDWNIPRAIPRNWVPPKNCATAEEMGAETVGDTRAASLRVRAMIRKFIAEHGAERVGGLSGKEFCGRGYVLGEAREDGFGNNMYKVLTAAGLAVMLNRSLIIAELGGTDPTYDPRRQTTRRGFGDYLEFSRQAFTVTEVRRLWAVHGCATKYKRPLIIQNDLLERRFRYTRCTCDDWTTLSVPILHFQGATGSGAMQLLLKNSHPAMRYAATELLGNPAVPSSRPNTFGELFRAFVAPNADIQEAVQWALQGGPDPDIALHLRMLHSRTRPAPAAASTCINRIRQIISRGRRRPRVVVVTDTPAILQGLQKSLGQTVEVVRFNYLAYIKETTNRSEVLSLSHGMPPRNRIRDWGEMPRWVAMVDFFLAARARTAVVSGAYRRVSTTYAQLVAALAAAYTLDELDASRPACVYYSSLQASLVRSGLASQAGWGHTWRPFGGRFGCRNQGPQCAQTALLPYTWWDAPWQSPIGADIRRLQGLAGLNSMGQVSEKAMDKFCADPRRRPVVKIKLQIPSYDEAVAAPAA